MVDIVSKETRSKMMASIRGSDTQPEMMLRRYLHGMGFRFNLHVRGMPGRPDLVLPKYRLAIFVHGCFWHRHPGCKLTTTPRTDPLKWQEKFTGNVNRDRRNTDVLLAEGWRVFVIWECGLTKAEAEQSLDWLPAAIKDPQQVFIDWPEKESGYRKH
jgi:DNA mismatch endonuclease (patch repair protein)